MSIYIPFFFPCSKLPCGSQPSTGSYSMCSVRRELLLLKFFFSIFVNLMSILLPVIFISPAASAAFPSFGKIQRNTRFLCSQGERCLPGCWTSGEGYWIRQNGLRTANNNVGAHKWIANGDGILWRNLISYNNTTASRHRGAQWNTSKGHAAILWFRKEQPKAQSVPG